MDGTGRTCLECQAPVTRSTRFCPKCGQPTSLALPGGPPPGPGEPRPDLGQGPVPTAPAPPAAGWAGQTRADWVNPAVARLPVRAPLPPEDPPYLPPASGGAFYGQAPQDPGGYATYPSAGAPPSGPFHGPPRQPPRRHDRNGSGTPLALWVVVLVILLGGGAAAGLLLAHPFSHPAVGESAGASPKLSASPGASAATTPAVTEQQAAANLAAMLNESVSDRSEINSAYKNVLACDSRMTTAPQVFDSAANSRRKLLAGLATMAGRAVLPPALLSDLTRAWQASVAADQAFARWASGELRSCVPDDTGSPAFQATITPDNNATRYKAAFVAQWNPVAAKYNLTRYQQNQL
jgi:hypothetical protein